MVMMLKKSFILLIILFFFCNNFLFAQTTENQITSISWENNSLIIDTTNKISYIESKLKDPDRLVIDILNCSFQDKKLMTSYKSEGGEDVSITEQSPDKVRILIIGSASINRKSYLSNNDRTLITRIARIETEVPDEMKNAESEKEKYPPGKFKDLTIESEEDETKVSVSASKSIKYSTYILKNPDRFAIDLLNILPPEIILPKFKPTPFVSGIRIGQAASGIEATRIVFDLSKSDLDCKVNSNLIGNKLEIKFKVNKEKHELVKKSGIKVVIDPGHGGYDTGASYGGFEEKDVNLVISGKLKKSLEDVGITVFPTRDDDNFLSLAERVEITNSIKPDVFISIHGNALVTSRVIRGVETYYWTSQSHKLAYFIHRSILNHIKIPDHYIRRAQFYVIRHASAPAVLAELGFLSNHDDRKLLTNSTTQDEYAKALTEAILKFLDIEQNKEIEKQNDKR